MNLQFRASNELRELHKAGLVSEAQYAKLALIEAMSEKGKLESEKKESYQDCLGKGSVVLG